ncbi:Phosphonoacetaldehyde hydrolase [Maioricimonas rarisocia]|uniref:phosphonoacetaldehyde hydrolase n=1 Tax=Maioricimonas rarisocia TaxID=2528026 RepID=A0A517Z386_9PLAN|nr:phosphonoacetaldehyde hydrolase [Maioricimonas rarisocia]QDU36954.1 Phosphonoacetaldehyde hydrolase [Maioricimonas rarisocia]
MSEAFKYLTAVVLDWAGTTVDFGSRAPAIAFQEIFRREEIEVSAAEAREPMGLAKRDHIAAILRMPNVARQWNERFSRDATEEDIDRLYDDFLPLQKEMLSDHSGVITGVPAVIDECRRRGLKIGSSTGYTHELMEVVCPRAADQGYAPDCLICSEDVSQGRPAPWILYEAARQIDCYPMCTIVKVDDTPVGIEAGRNAGAWTVGVTRSGNCVGLSEDEFEALDVGRQRELLTKADERLRAAGADMIVESVADLIPCLEQFERRLAGGALPRLPRR